MKKTALFIIAAVLLLSALAACTQQEEGGASSQPEGGTGRTAPKTELTVFAAASMTETLDSLVEAYKKIAPDLKITVTCDSSGALKKQIQEGAACDIFISASQKQMNQLDASVDAEGGNSEGLDFVMPGTRVNLLQNSIVLAVPADNKAEINSFEDLGTEKLKLLCIGDEDVPVGVYSQEILKNLKLWDRLRREKKLTYASDVKEVTSQVKEGAVDAGIIYATDAFSARIRIAAKAGDELCSPAIYPAAVMRGTQNKKAAKKFMKFLQSPEAEKIFTAAGFCRIDK